MRIHTLIAPSLTHSHTHPHTFLAPSKHGQLPSLPGLYGGQQWVAALIWEGEKGDIAAVKAGYLTPPHIRQLRM